MIIAGFKFNWFSQWFQWFILSRGVSNRIVRSLESKHFTQEPCSCYFSAHNLKVSKSIKRSSWVLFDRVSREFWTMWIVRCTAMHIVLVIFCAFHLSDGRLDFWNAKKEKHVNDLNPNKFSPVIFSKYLFMVQFCYLYICFVSFVNTHL